MKDLKSENVDEPIKKRRFPRSFLAILPLAIIAMWVGCPRDDTVICYEYHFDNVTVPLVVHWSNEADVLVSPYGYVYLPRGTTRYTYTVHGKEVSGKVENHEAGEWYMEISDQGITIYK